MPALLQPMPVISRNVPAYTNDNNGGSNPASYANNFIYGQQWKCATAVVGNADSGNLTQAVYVAYDLSGVPVSQRQNVVLIWYNDPVSTFAPTLAGIGFNNMPTAYTIETNTAAGGSYPSSGWTVQATVTGNSYATRLHAFNLNGANWVRINITAVHGTAGFSTNRAALTMDVHDAHMVDNGVTVYGDSLGDIALNHDDLVGDGLGLTEAGQINAARPAHWPYWIRACIPGYTAFDFSQLPMSTFLPLYTGSYVVLQIGANDANQGGGYLTNFTTNMQTIINACAAASKICIIPHVHWARTTNMQTNGPTVNGYIDALIAANPTTTMAGPDMWTYFLNNQNLITTLGPPDNDGLHPTTPVGMAAYRTQFALWAEANLYGNVLQSTARTNYKVRTILNSAVRTNYKVRTQLAVQTRTNFLIKLSTTGPKPYNVPAVVTKIAPRPFSTISSQASVVDQNNLLQDNLTATVTVTFPDNSVAAVPVYWLGSGAYSVVYTLKGAGATTELWTFIDSQGSSVEYQHVIQCQF